MYDWKKGASFSLMLGVKSGSVVGTEPIRAVLKKADVSHIPPADSEPELFEFTVQFVAAAGDVPDHWLLSATAADGEALDVGEYAVDARIEIGGGVIQTEHVLIKLLPRVTGRP